MQSTANLNLIPSQLRESALQSDFTHQPLNDWSREPCLSSGKCCQTKP